MKKIIARILFLGLCVICMFNVKSFCASDFLYTIDNNGNAKITAYKGAESNLTIPSTIDGHKVITIGAHAFDESRNSTNGSTIKNVTISEGIERIELLAFVKCANLETVKLPESLNFLDMQTFLQCTNLKKINIPSKIVRIANSTFQETGLIEFDIPENVKSIDSRALGICSNLENVRVYSKDIVYAEGAFEHSPKLVLYGYEGSTTQKYAQQNGIKFEILKNVQQEKPIVNTEPSNFNNSELENEEPDINNTVNVEENEEQNLNNTVNTEEMTKTESHRDIIVAVGIILFFVFLSYKR